MDDSPGKTLDLKVLAETLPESWSKLRQLIVDLTAVHSAHTDLTLAADLAERLLQVHQARDKMPRQFAADAAIAFLWTAITCYARATKSGSKHRKTFDIRRFMDAEELERHDLICALRDDAIAHYGPGKFEADGSLRSDHIFLVKGGQIFFASRNLTGSLAVADKVRVQAQRALIVMQRLHEEKESAVVDYLNEHGDELVRLGFWKPAVVDLAEAIGAEMAAEIMEGPRVGRRRLSDDGSGGVRGGPGVK